VVLSSRGVHEASFFFVSYFLFPVTCQMNKDDHSTFLSQAGSQKPTASLEAFTIFLLLLSMASAGCRGSQSTQGPEPGLQELTDEILGPGNTIELNDTKTFALCEQNHSADHARRIYQYIVVRLEDHSIAHEGDFRMGYVKWMGPESIEVVSGSSSAKEGSTKKIIHVTSPVE